MLVARGTLVLALLLLAQLVPAAEPDEPADVAAIFAKMRANLARISSIEFTAGYTDKLYHQDEVARTLEKEIILAHAAGKYRCRYLMRASDLAEHWTDNAYDGQRYQEFFGDRQILQRSSKPHHSAYGVTPPFLEPYGWVAKPGKPYTLECFLDEAAWNSAAANAVLEGRDEIDGHPCQIVSMKIPVFSNEQIRRIHLATDLDFLPIRVQWRYTAHQDGESPTQGQVRVTQSESLQTPAGRVVIAMSTESEITYGRAVRINTTMADRSVTQQWINADGLKVNQGISPERFTIPLDQVKRIIDED